MGSPQSAGLRYVHMFAENDLEALAGQTGWRVEASEYHDGHTGNLGLYQVWRAV
jgi:hypothetical protein